MKKLLVLGNGFDLSCCRETRYMNFADFIESYQGTFNYKPIRESGGLVNIAKRKNELIDILLFVLNDEDRNLHIADKFYECIDNNYYFDLFTREFNESIWEKAKWMDLENTVKESVKEVHDEDQLKIMYMDLKRITQALEMYLHLETVYQNRRVPSCVIDEHILREFPVDYVINYNYTSVYTSLVNPEFPENQLYYIHGKANMYSDTDDPGIVFGIDDEGYNPTSYKYKFTKKDGLESIRISLSS